MPDREKHIDESWKDSVAREKEGPEHFQPRPQDSGIITPGAQEPEPTAPEQDETSLEVTFINYVSSLVFQTMIFLGEMPNPITNQTEKNLHQAKFLIDTLIMMREKTKGNLTKHEDDLLNSAVYELQMRFVDLLSKETPQGGGNV